MSTYFAIGALCAASFITSSERAKNAKWHELISITVLFVACWPWVMGRVMASDFDSSNKRKP
jgi:hypothetical protein